MLLCLTGKHKSSDSDFLFGAEQQNSGCLIRGGFQKALSSNGVLLTWQAKPASSLLKT